MRDEEIKRAGPFVIKRKKKACGCGGNNAITLSKGEIIIQVTRQSFTINQPLPYCIWGSLYVNSLSFPQVLEDYLPPGITVTTSVDTNTLVFTYTDSSLPPNSDTITVTVPDISLTSYLEILTNLNTNYMRTNFVVWDCNAGINPPGLQNSDINNLQAQGLYLQQITGGQNKDVQLIIPKSRTQINNSVKNVIELYMRNEPVKAQTVWIHQFGWVDPATITPAQIEYTYTVFISKLINMNREKIRVANSYM
ncbi:MAG: hypothetical protein ACXVPD_06545 [Bacteroidia bacterium]